MIPIIPLPTTEEQPETVILANGSFPCSYLPLTLLHQAQYIVCCDGATDNLLEYTHLIPDAIVGDCDSLSPQTKERFINIIHHTPDQNTNDLTKAIHLCISKQKHNITILGATGKREDHTLANIFLLAHYLQFPNTFIRLITNDGVFEAIHQNTRFESKKGQQVSLFSIDKTTSITTHNLKFPLMNNTLSELWCGTLNESVDNHFQIDVRGGRLIVFRSFSIKYKMAE